MNRLVENGIISEMQCGNNFAYILNDSSLLLSTEYKVLQSQEAGCFVKCMKLLFNGKTQFYYLTNGYKPFANMIPSLDADSFITIITNVFSNVLTVKQNGFLSCENVDIAFDRIFVDPSTYKVALLYLPISKRLYADTASFENELRTSLVKVISGISTLSSPKTIQLMSDLSNGMLSIEDLYHKLKGGATFTKAGSSNSGDETWNRSERQDAQLRLVAMNAPARVEILVTKDDFVIGKKATEVDGVVSFNRMISRVHCKVTKENGQFMITDLQSANGTYVNRVKLMPTQPHMIKNGDIVRLANSDFQVVIS